MAVVAGSGTTATYTDTPLSPPLPTPTGSAMSAGTGYSDYTAPVSATTAARPAGTPWSPPDWRRPLTAPPAPPSPGPIPTAAAASYLIETAPTATPARRRGGSCGQTAPAHQLRLGHDRRDLLLRAGAGGQRVRRQRLHPAVHRPLRQPRHRVAQGIHRRPRPAVRQLAPWTGPSWARRHGPNLPQPRRQRQRRPLLREAADQRPRHRRRPINIVGVPDRFTGQLPIIDGTNAVTATQWKVSYLPLEDLSLVLIGADRGQNSSTAGAPGTSTWRTWRSATLTAAIPTPRPTPTPPLTARLAATQQGSGSTSRTGTTSPSRAARSTGTTRASSARPGGPAEPGGPHPRLRLHLRQRHRRRLPHAQHVHRGHRHAVPVRHLRPTAGRGLRHGAERPGPAPSSAKLVPGRWAPDRPGGGPELPDRHADPGVLQHDLRLRQPFYNPTGGASTPIHYGGDQGVAALNRKGVLEFYDNTS